MFFGRYDYTIDAKGRLNFPAKFRDAMGESFVVLEWVDNCLFVLPLPEVEKLAEKLEADELMDSWEATTVTLPVLLPKSQVPSAPSLPLPPRWAASWAALPSPSRPPTTPSWLRL